jgi:long-chain fatty acid transport protein
LRTLFTLVLLTLAVAVVFAGGYQINEHGTKAMGMGGAFAAQASDPSAIFFNPAGLTQLKGINVMIGGTAIMPVATFSGPTLPGFTSTSTDMVKQTFFPPNAYVTYNHGDWAFGIGFFAPFGLGTEWPASWGGVPAIGQYEAYITDLQAFYINPTVAYRFNDQLSVGVGASYVFGTVKFKQKINDPAFGGAVPDWNSALEGTGTGINFNLGVMYKPTPKLSIGVSYRFLTEIEFEGDVAFTDIPNVQVPIAPGVTIPLAALFPDQGAKAKIPMPSNLFAGVAYDFSDYFTLEADFQFVGWSAYKELKISFEDGVAGDMDITEPGDYKDTYLIRVGGEYRLTDLALRAGFIYDASPIPDKSLGPRLPDGERLEGTVGLGYAFSEMLRVDLAYQYITMKDRTVTAPTNGFPGTYKSSASLFGVNIGLSF